MKKSTHKLLIAVALLLVAMVAFAACDEVGGGGKLSVKYDDSHVFTEGDDLETVKNYLTVTYTDADGTTSKITDFELSGKLSKGESQLTVTYKGVTTTVTVKVSEIPVGDVEIRFDENCVIYENDDLETVKHYLTVIYTNAEGVATEITDYTLSSELTAGECELTVRYNGITATVTVHVEGQSNEHIWAVFKGDDITICEGDDLEKVREYLDVTYTDAEGNTVQIEDYALNGQIVGGECELTVTYNGFTTWVQILVAYKPTLSVENAGYFFHVDDKLEKVKEGLRVYYKESDGKTHEVGDYELIGTLTQGACELTVAYNGLTAKVVVDVVANNSLWVKQMDDDSAIYDTDDLFTIRNHLYVMYTDFNGNSDVVYDYTLDGDITFGKCELTVTYKDLSAKVTVDVKHWRSLSVELDEGFFYHENDKLDSIKPYLRVTYTDEDNVSTQISNYRLQGELKSGKCWISVIYDYTADQCVSNDVYVDVVSNNSLLVMVQKDAVIYPNDDLEVVKEYLTVIYTDSNGKSNVVNDYTLEGSYYPGNIDLTVRHNGIVTNVSVTVSCNHVFSEWEVIGSATCVNPGLCIRVCTLCGYKEEQISSQLSHNLMHHEAHTATCEAEGNVEYWYCSVCETYFGDEDCTKELSSDAVTLPKAHVFGAWVEKVSATCTNTGTKGYQYCSVCQKNYDADGNEIEDVTLPFAHVFDTWVNEVSATCTETGTKGYQYCFVCQKYYDAEGLEIQDFTIPKADHKSSVWIEDEYATCTEDGSKHKECTVCHETLETATIPAGHIFGDWVEEVPASCSIGFVGYKMCMRCYGYFDAEENQIYDLVIPAVHSPGDWIVDMEATCTVEGQKHRECTVCHEYLDRTYYYVEHEFEEWVEKRPVTCMVDGTKGYQYCTSCHKYYDATGVAVEYRDLIIPAEGHKAGADWIVDVEANCFEEGSKHKECTVCHGVAVTEIIPITHSCGSWVEKVSATCTEAGQVAHYTCTICGVNLDENYNKLNSLVIPAPGHSYKNGYCSVCSWEEQSEGLAYTLSLDGTYYIVSCGTCTDGKVIIPKKHEGLPVKAIGDDAFKDCTTITSVVIPSCVTSIGKSAFSGCENLREVYITNLVAWCNITFGGNNSSNPLYEAGRLFLNGEQVNNLAIPSTVTEIKPYAFCGIAVSNILIPEGVTVIGNGAFIEGHVSNRLATDITIPASVTSIGNDAFSGHWNIRSITICDNSQLKSIGDYAFYNMPLLESVTFGENSKLESIGNYAFHVCGKLTDITIPDSVTSIGKGAFKWCDGLTSIVVPRGVTNIGEEAFSGCDGLASVTFDDNSQLTTIGEKAFSGCYSLTSIGIPDSVTSIGLGAFSGCSGLTSITIPFVGAKAGVTSSDTYQYPFGYIFGTNSYTGGTKTYQSYYESSTSNTTYGTYYYIPSSLKSVTVTGGNILYGAFVSCRYLTSIVIPSDVTSISYAFAGCRNLTSMVIPQSVTSIDYNAFANCYKLLEVYNLSSLEMTAGSSNNGQVAYYAKDVYTSLDNPSKVSTDSNGYVVYTNGGTKILLRYDGDETELELPDGITEINASAFYGCGDLTKIAIPDSVTSIGSNAFRDCKGIVNVTLGKNSQLKSIGREAFYNCENLAGITIPATVTSIERDAFYGCESLVAVNITDVAAWCDIDFDDYHTSWYCAYNLYLNGELVTKLEIPSTVTEIKHGAFGKCSSLTSVVIPASVKSIDAGAFRYCISLASIEIPASVTTIGDSVFYGCSSLTSVTFGKNSQIEVIGSSAFGSCDNLKFNEYGNALYLGTKTNLYFVLYKASSTDITSCAINETTGIIANGAFDGCTGITNVTFGENSQLELIGSSAFRGCSSLTSITIPDSVISIGANAFESCSSLTNVIIGDSVTSIGAAAFYGCGFIGIVIPKSVMSIGTGAFSSCSNLTSMELPTSVTLIGRGVFSQCDSLEEITFSFIDASDGSFEKLGYLFDAHSSSASKIPTSLKKVTITSTTKIGNDAFSGCSSITEVVLPNGVTSIGNGAFADCSSLTKINIPSSVTSIDDGAFVRCENLSAVHITDLAAWCDIEFNFYTTNPLYYAHNLYINGNLATELQLPSTVIEIKSYAFCGVSLASINIPNSVTSIGYGAFQSSTIEKVTFAESSQLQSIGVHAFLSCQGLTSISIPNSVTSIGYEAFAECRSLISVKLSENITSLETWTFFNCISLTSVVFGENSLLESIGNHAFCNCSSLSSIVIPSGVKTIYYNAFLNCDSLTSIVIPGSVKTIGSNVFKNCGNLTIHCEASSQPSGWDDEWNPSNCPVVWGCVAEE